MGINGIQGSLICVECYITNGLPNFDIVGLPDTAVKEARERVRAAAKVCGMRIFPSPICLIYGMRPTCQLGRYKRRRIIKSLWKQKSSLCLEVSV